MNEAAEGKNKPQQLRSQSKLEESSDPGLSIDLDLPGVDVQIDADANGIKIDAAGMQPTIVYTVMLVVSSNNECRACSWSICTARFFICLLFLCRCRGGGHCV